MPLRRAKMGSAAGSVVDSWAQPDASKADAATASLHGAAAAEPQAEIAPSQAAGAAVGDAWRRIVLLPGIELHIAVHEDRRFNRIVARLLDAAHRILAEEPEKAEDNR